MLKPLELIKFSSYLCIRRIKIYRLRFRAIIYDSCTILVHEVFWLHETFSSISISHQLGIVNLWIYYKYITSRCSQILLLNSLLSLLGHISDIPVYRFICTLFLKHILILTLNKKSSVISVFLTYTKTWELFHSAILFKVIVPTVFSVTIKEIHAN